jgi:hypothetical protein
MKSIRDLQKKEVNLTGITPGSVDDVENDEKDISENIKNTADTPAKVNEEVSSAASPEINDNDTVEGNGEAVDVTLVDNTNINEATEKSTDSDNKREKKITKETVHSVQFHKGDVFQSLLSKEKTYNNGNKPIIIDVGLKDNLDILSAVSSVPVSTIVNNLLNMIFSNDSVYNLNFNVTEYLLRRQKENITKLNKFK